MEQITLKKLNVFNVSVSVSEMKSKFIGFYENKEIAERDTKGKGWYGCNGSIKPQPVWTDGQKFYELKELGEAVLQDELSKSKAEALKKVQSILTPDEIKALGLSS